MSPAVFLVSPLDLPPQLHLEQAVVIAAGIQPTGSHPGKPQGTGLLRVGPLEQDPIGGHLGEKADEMFLGHGVVHGDVPIVLHLLHLDAVGLVGLLSLQRRQVHPATVEGPLAHGVDHIAADRTDVELAPQHVPRPVPVGLIVPGEQLGHGDPQGPGQGLQQGDVGQTLARFP